MNLITIDRARAHCRADSTDDDLLTLYVGAAETSAQQFLGRNVYANQADLDAAETSGNAGDRPMVVTEDIAAAILLIAGHLYRNREEVIAGQAAAAVQVPVGARYLLMPYRIGMGV